MTKYVLESGNEFGDINRVILAGDSAGGNIVAVLTQRFNQENIKKTKLQVLIYPWTQLVSIYNTNNIFYIYQYHLMISNLSSTIKTLH